MHRLITPGMLSVVMQQQFFFRTLAWIFGLALSTSTVHAEAGEDLAALREAVRQGKALPLEAILEDALRHVPGKVVEVEFDLEDDEYEIEILDADGQVWELEYRASDGSLIEIEHDD